MCKLYFKTVAQEEFPVAEMTFKGHSKSLALTLFGRSL